MIKKWAILIILSGAMSLSFASGKDIENGYNYQAGKINAKLQESEALLNKCYDFQTVAIDGKLPPAIICRDKDMVEVENFDNPPDMKCSILYPARSLYKNEKTKEVYSWKDLLFIPVKEKVINMKDNEDFMLGVANANELLQINVVKLTRMSKGMITYRILELKGLTKSIKEK